MKYLVETTYGVEKTFTRMFGHPELSKYTPSDWLGMDAVTDLTGLSKRIKRITL